MNSPVQIAENYIEIGTSKTKTPPLKVFLLAIMAGLFVGIAGTASSAAVVSVSLPSVQRLIAACIFPAGLAMVILAGSELFTGNCLLIIPIMEKKIKVSDMVKNLVIVYIGNLCGSVILTLLLGYGGIFSLFGNGMAESCVATATAKVQLSFSQALFKGILCNIFVALAVWMALAAKTAGGKIAAFFYPIHVFVICGFEHCVANMSYIPNGLFCKYYYGMESADLTIGAFFVKNLLPVTIGNIIGGCMIGLIYWYIYLHKTEQK